MKKTLLLIALTFVFSMVKAQDSIFPATVLASSEINTGIVHVQLLSQTGHQQTYNFVFEKGSRNSWHIHPEAQQVLMILSGEAYYQEEGKEKRILRKGDVITTPANIRHWNGATPWSDCECITITDIATGKEHAIQYEKVSDQEYLEP